jgi:hypothetical protein
VVPAWLSARLWAYFWITLILLGAWGVALVSRGITAPAVYLVLVLLLVPVVGRLYGSGRWRERWPWNRGSAKPPAP